MADTVENLDFENAKKRVFKIKGLLSDSDKKLDLLLENEHLLSRRDIQEATAFIILGHSAIERILKKENIYL